jgi:tetratricopeptide (TPR) repeat protein
MIESLADADEATRRDLVSTLHQDPSAPNVYQRLADLTNRFTRDWPDSVKKHVATFEVYDPEDSDAEAFADSLRAIADELDSQPREALSGQQLHLRAVIYHHLKELDAALRYYDAAIDRYALEDQPALRSLCLLDSGELLHDFRQPALSHTRFRRAWKELKDSLAPGEPLPPLFELYAKGMEADAHRRIGNLGEAESLLNDVWVLAETLSKSHPLRAFALERRGWLQLDNWKLPEARADFQAALAIRENQDPENHRARHFIYWDKQGVGMAHLYDGESNEARQQFEELLAKIDRPPSEITRKQRDELLDRRPNLHERLADALLFTGAAAPMGEADATAHLDAAIGTAEDQGFFTDGRKSVLIRLQYKAAVVRALQGNVKGAEQHLEAARAMETVDPKPSASSESSATRRRATPELTKQAALAAVRWKSDGMPAQDTGRRELMEMIAEVDVGLPRDDLLLLLYIGAAVLESNELAPRERTALAGQMQTMIGVQPFPPQGATADDLPPRVPGLFRRYLQIAEQASAKE